VTDFMRCGFAALSKQSNDRLPLEIRDRSQDGDLKLFFSLIGVFEAVVQVLAEERHPQRTKGPQENPQRQVEHHPGAHRFEGRAGRFDHADVGNPLRVHGVGDPGLLELGKVETVVLPVHLRLPFKLVDFHLDAVEPVKLFLIPCKLSALGPLLGHEGLQLGLIAEKFLLHLLIGGVDSGTDSFVPLFLLLVDCLANHGDLVPDVLHKTALVRVFVQHLLFLELQLRELCLEAADQEGVVVGFPSLWDGLGHAGELPAKLFQPVPGFGDPAVRLVQVRAKGGVLPEQQGPLLFKRRKIVFLLEEFECILGPASLSFKSAD
jgi:hypothetical protein